MDRTSRSRSRSPRRSGNAPAAAIEKATDSMLDELFGDNDDTANGKNDQMQRRNSTASNHSGRHSANGSVKNDAQEEWVVKRTVIYADNSYNVYDDTLKKDENGKLYLEVFKSDDISHRVGIFEENWKLWDKAAYEAAGFAPPAAGSAPNANGEAPVESNPKKASSELTPAEKNIMKKRFNVIKTKEIPQYLKGIMKSGEQQNAILDTSNGRGITARKRFMCNKAEDGMDTMPNCPEFMTETFEAFFKSQPSVTMMKVDYDFKNKMSFVLEISPEAWQYYLEQTNCAEKSNKLRHEANLKMLIEKLNVRNYDSDTGLLGWKSALGLMRQLSRTEMTLDQFKKFKVDKCVMPYRKHQDMDVKKISLEIIHKFKDLYEQEKQEKANGGVAPSGSETQPDASEEDIDDLF